MEHEAHPKEKDSLSIPLAVVLAGVLIAGAILFSNNTRALSPSRSPSIPDRALVGADANQAPVDLLALHPGDHVLGNPDANVLVIEYSDTECPFCKRFHETMHQAMGEYGKGGGVAWVYRHSPIDQLHPKARKESEAFECANEQGGNDAFWKYADKLFEITPSNNGLDLAQLPVIARAIGLDAGKFSACLASGKYADHVQKDFENGVNVGVKGTPYTVVWNKKTGKQMPIEGAYPLSNVKSILDVVISSQGVPAK